MAIPKDPRQQMINIMYLVLIAMLALNVSNEIVNAFKLLNKGLKSSNESIDNKITGSFKQFEAAVEKNPEGQKYLDRASQLNTYADEFVSKIAQLQSDINMDAAKGDAAKLDEEGLPEKLDNQDTPTRMMIADGGADRVEAMITEYRNKFMSAFEGEDISDADRTEFESALLLAVGEPSEKAAKKGLGWAEETFNQMPLISAVTLLEKFKSDAKNSAAAGVDILKNNVSKEEILYDAFDVAIVPSASKLIQGEKFSAEVFLTASSSASKPTISINNKGYSVDAGGRATYETTANSLGKKSITANLTYKDGFGKSKTLTKKFDYEVVPPPDHVPVVSATKMNAFYIGVANPVAASITGVRNNKTSVSMTGGSISPEGAGTYTVTVSSPGEVNINLSGTNEQGKKLNYSVPFRAKRIPDPVPMIGKQPGGTIKSGNFKAQQGLRAVLEDFLFDAKFKVISYELTLARPSQDLRIAMNQGGKYAGQANTLVQEARPGDVYYFDRIKAQGPDGKNRQLPSIVFKVN